MARSISYPTKFKNLVSTSPVLFSDFNTEINQIYQNFTDLDADFAFKDGEAAQSFSLLDLSVYGQALFSDGSQVNPAGTIIGNLIFNTTALPPKVSSGTREVGGKNIQETADVAIALTDAFGVCSQLLADYQNCWLKILVNDQGQYKFIPSYDSEPVGTLTDIVVSSISVTGGLATVSTSNTTSLAAGHMVIIKDSDIGYLIGKVTAVTAGVSFQVKTSASNGTYSGGTYSARYRISTLHGSGSLTGVNTDADIEKYTPSPEFNPVLQGYFRDIDGDIVVDATGVWRDLGAFFVDGSSNVTHVISYKSGKNKDDNNLYCDTHNGFGSTDNKIPRFTNYTKLWGNDYVAIDTASTGLYITFQDSRKFFASFTFQSGSGVGCETTISLNAVSTTDTTASPSTITTVSKILCSDANSSITGEVLTHNVFTPYYYQKNDVIRPHTDGLAPSSNGSAKFVLTGM